MKDNKHIQSLNEHQQNLNISDVMNSILSELQTLKDKYLHDNADYDEYGKGHGVAEAMMVIKKYYS